MMGASRDVLIPVTVPITVCQTYESFFRAYRVSTWYWLKVTRTVNTCYSPNYSLSPPGGPAGRSGGRRWRRRPRRPRRRWWRCWHHPGPPSSGPWQRLAAESNWNKSSFTLLSSSFSFSVGVFPCFSTPYTRISHSSLRWVKTCSGHGVG